MVLFKGHKVFYKVSVRDITHQQLRGAKLAS